MAQRPMRRRYLVQRGPQARFIAVFTAIGLAGALATALASGLTVHGELGAAMFRAHLGERSTGELVLPVLMRVNGAAALTTMALGIVAGVLLFRRQARDVDELCVRLAGWQRGHGLEHPPATDWAAAVEHALREADGALRTTYREAAERAAAVAAAAERLSQAGSSTEDVESIRSQVESVAASLGKFQAPSNTRS